MIITSALGGGVHGYLFADLFQTFLMPTSHRVCISTFRAFLGSAASAATYNSLDPNIIQKAAGLTSLTMVALVEGASLYEGLFVDSNFLLPTFLMIGSTFAGVATGIVCSHLFYRNLYEARWQ